MVSDTQIKFNKAFVTGATGFIGRSLVQELLDVDVEVVALVRDPASPGIADGTVALRGDLGGVTGLKDSVEDCEIVFHLAARTPKPGISAPEYRSTNVDGTANIIDLCLETGKRLVFVSTVNVDLFRNGVVTDPYSESKSEAEYLVEKAIENGLDAVIVRPAYVFGNEIGQGGALIDKLLARKLRVLPSPGRMFCPAFVGDVARATRLAGARGASGSTYTVAGRCQSLGDFVDTVCGAQGLKRPTVRIPDWSAVLVLRTVWLLKPVTRWTPPITVSALKSGAQFDGTLAADSLGFEYSSLEDLFGEGS